MAADTAVKMWSRKSGSYETVDLCKRIARFREGYTITHDPNEPETSILNAAGLPQLGDAFEGNNWVFAKRQVPNQVSPVFTIVEIEYEGEVGPNNISGSPIDDPPEISWENVVSTEAIDEDADGNPIATANNEPIEGATKEISDFLLAVKRNYISINLPATHAYLESTNSDTYEGFAPGVAHLEKFKANKIICGGGNTYWEVDARILFRVPYNTTPDKAWWFRTRHEGYRFKTSDDRIINAIDDNQANVSRPVLLKQDGTIETNPANAYWLEFKRYPNQLSYTALGLT